MIKKQIGQRRKILMVNNAQCVQDNTKEKKNKNKGKTESKRMINGGEEKMQVKLCVKVDKKMKSTLTKSR